MTKTMDDPHSNDAARVAMQQRVALLQAEELKRRLQV